MGLADLFRKRESLVSIDIGSSGVKLLELDTSGSKPRLVNIGYGPLNGEIFSGNAVSKPEKVAEQITALLEANSITDKRVVVAMPGPSVFTKKIKMPKMDLNELSTNIQFEAGNFIPHNVDAVRLDYHVIGESTKNQLDVLVVAVKNEIIDSFTFCLNTAGLEPGVIDVDYFALQNMFELGYPEAMDKTCALINIGARYSSINICRDGEALFTGDISVGGKIFTDAIMEGLGLQEAEAEKLKRDLRNPPKDGDASAKELHTAAREFVDQKVEYAASEFSRQLSFFWNASGSEGAIDAIYVSGGGALTPRLIEELAEKAGIACTMLDPFRGLAVGEEIDQQYLKELAPVMAVGVGMGIRYPGDKIIPDI